MRTKFRLWAILMQRPPLIFITVRSCGQGRNVQLTDWDDPDVVLINIEERDRAFKQFLTATFFASVRCG